MSPHVQREDEFVRLFEEEASVRLGRLSEQIPQLRRDGHQADLLASIFRDAHSIRGAAAVVGLEPVQRVAHAMEKLLEPAWRDRRQVTPWIVDAAQSAVRALQDIIPGVIAGEDVSARAAAAERSLAAVTSIRVEEPGVGPDHHQEPTSIVRSLEGGHGAPEGSTNVLVVDDAATVREVQRSILERAGYEVRTARDGLEALELLAERRCDLVVVDIEMPRMDGYALMEAIRAEPSYESIPIIVLTSRSADSDRRRSLDAGADAYVNKSGFDPAGFLRTVGRLVGGTP
jgi:CheY-like chemotaxis protein/HPt (histidine-containing phosphotransfer) domain-containing protein